jgi:RecB family exonuclease
VLAAALAEAEAHADAGDLSVGNEPAGSTARAAFHVAVLDEMDPDLATAEGRAADRRLGPYFGLVGPARHADDPRHGTLWVTRLEQLAACPWQVFVEKVLRVEPTPDPLQALPGVDPLLLGNLVHRVLEKLVAEPLGEPRGTLEQARSAPPVPVAWPADDALDRLVAEQAEDLVAEEGVPLPGLARALAARARPFLEAARRTDWPHPGDRLAALGAEVTGTLEVADGGGARRAVHFRADRVDAVGGGLRLTDYKTGRPISSAKTSAYRRKHLLKAVTAGTRLQAVAYALAAAGRGATPAAAGQGRYLFLGPEVESPEVVVATGDGELVAAFSAAAAAVLDAWDAGAFFPRVVDPAGRREPPRCGFCAVAEACLRGDSGARRRLAAWAGGDLREEAAPDAELDAAAALRAVWALPAGGDGEER